MVMTMEYWYVFLFLFLFLFLLFIYLFIYFYFGRLKKFWLKPVWFGYDHNVSDDDLGFYVMSDLQIHSIQFNFVMGW